MLIIFRQCVCRETRFQTSFPKCVWHREVSDKSNSVLIRDLRSRMAQIGQQAFCATGRTCSKHEPHSDKNPTWTPWTDHFVTRSCLILCTTLDRTCYSHVRHQVWVSRNAGNYSSGFRKHLARRQGVRGSHSGDSFARFRISDDRSREPTHGRPRTMHFWEGNLALSSEMNMIFDTLSVIIGIGCQTCCPRFWGIGGSRT